MRKKDNVKVRKRSKAKRRLFIAFIIFGLVLSTLGYNLIINISNILSMKQQKKDLESKIESLKEEEKVLESDIQKLEDPTYVARYAREKYLYSKDGELIIRIPDE